MKVGIVVVVYSEYPNLVFDSIIGNTTHDLTWYIHCHSTNKSIEDSLLLFCESNKCDLRLHRNNRGLARSWNDGIFDSYSSGQDFTLVINDDVCFRPGAFDFFITFLMDKPAFALGFLHGEEPAYDDTPSVTRSQDFACFALGMLAYARIGAFDENFFPAYKEDTDYFIRIKKLDLPVIIDTRVLVDHERSKTIKRSPELRANIEAIGHASNAYLFRKWGWGHDGPTYEEQFETRGCFIPWGSRRAPFQIGLDREDLPIDKVPALHVRGNLGPETFPTREAIDSVVARQKAICSFVVQAIYRGLLQRDAEPNAIARYSQEFLSGARGISEFCDEVRRSPEYRFLTNSEATL